MSADRNYSTGGWMVVMAGVNYGLFTLVGIGLARLMSPHDFGEYGAAIVVAGIAATGATLGLEKSALALAGGYRARGEHGHLKGYIIFGLAISIIGAIACAVITAQIHAALKPDDWGEVTAVNSLLWFLPVLVAFSFLVEVAASQAKYLTSTAIYRVLIPMAILLAMVPAAVLGRQLTSHQAVTNYGDAWGVGLVAIIALVWVAMPQGALGVSAKFLPREWLREGANFLLYSLLMSLMGTGTIVILQYVDGDKTSLGHFTAVSQVGGFLIVAVTATNRLFAPKLALCVQAGDQEGQRDLLASRRRLLLRITVPFLLVMCLFGGRLLDLYGPRYDKGWLDLVVYSAGASVGVVFGMSPWYLQFCGRHALALGITTVGLLTGTILTIILIRMVGTIGAAWGFLATNLLVLAPTQIAASHIRSQRK